MNAKEMMGILSRVPVEGMIQRNNNLMGCCPSPEHEDRNPSWGISLTAPHLHGCFGCGFRGSLFTLLKYHSNMPLNEVYAITGKPDSIIKSIWNTEQELEDVFDPTVIYPFVFNQTVAAYARKRGCRPATFEKLDLVYDHIDNRIIVPWYKGERLVGVTAKPLPKGNMLPLSEFKKSKALFMPTRKIVRSSPLILVEGEFDAIKVYDSGFHNVAGFGFGVMSKAQESLLLNSGVREFILFFDHDQRGSQLTHEVCKRLSKCRTVHCVDWTQFAGDSKLDPGALSRLGVRVALRHRLKYRANWTQF